MWESPSDLAEYNSLLTSVEAYAGSTVAGLERLLKCKKAEFWLYRGLLDILKPKDAKFYMLVCVGETSAHTGKVLNLVPVGDYKPETALGIGWAKIRQIVDRRGLTKFYGCPLVDYSNKNLNKFYSLIEKRCWEVAGVERDESNSYTYYFDRSRDCGPNDAKWP